MGQCPAKSPFWVVFSSLIFKFFNFPSEPLSNGPYASKIGPS